MGSWIYLIFVVWILTKSAYLKKDNLHKSVAFFLNSQVVDLEIFSYIGNWLSKLECIMLKDCCNFFRQISFKRWTVMALWTTGQTGKLMEIIIYLSYNNFCSFWERGHLHDGVILLLWPGSFRVLHCLLVQIRAFVI